MKRILIFWNILLTIVIAYMGIRFCLHDPKPFDDIFQWDITAIYVYCYDYPPYEIPRDEYEPVLEALSHVVIYQRDDSYTEYMGLNPATFWIETQTGKRIVVASGNPFFFIDSIGYRTELSTSYEVARIYREYEELIRSSESN